MLHPKRIDGRSLTVAAMPDGRVFVDPSFEKTRSGSFGGRGGPEYSRHFCRFEDYGLADGVLRCRKCGLVKQVAGVV